MIEIIDVGYLKITYSLSRFLRLVNTLLGRVWMAGECVKYLSKVIVKQGIRYFLKEQSYVSNITITSN